jgi:hypothetical protein
MEPKGMKRCTKAIVVAIILSFLACLSAQAQEADPEGWFPVWIDETAEVEDSKVQDLLGWIDQQSVDQIVILVHGFAIPRDNSTDVYNLVARRLHDEFAKHGKKAAIVGLQWDSEIPKLFFLQIPGAYQEKKLYARRVGRQGTRRILLEIQDRFSKMPLNTLGHSMGCEVLGAAFGAEVEFREDGDEPPVIYRSQVPIHFNIVCFAGSDLDYDAAYQSEGYYDPDASEAKILWMTLAERVFDPGDKVLNLRALIRGPAMGATFPLLSEPQYDQAFSNREIVFEVRNIPKYHKLRDYYNEERIAHLVPSMLYVADPDRVAKPRIIADIDAVLDAPADVDEVEKFLHAKQISPVIYALWRLEHILGDGSKHLSDESLPKVAKALRRVPRKIRKYRHRSDCETVRRGLWPTERDLARAGHPQRESLNGMIWQRDFRGKVIELEEDELKIRTQFGDVRRFQFTQGISRFTPSLASLKVGSYVELKADAHHLRTLRLISFPEWIATNKRARKKAIESRGPSRGQP